MMQDTLPTLRTITKILVFTTVLIVWVLLGIASAQAGRVIATDKFPKPADPLFSPARITFDCTPLQTLHLSPGFLDTLRNDTTGGESLIPGYSCAAWPEEGPEHIYRLELSETMEIFAGLRDLDSVDLDLFLLNACDTDSCLVGANLEFSIILEPGTYHLIVDGAGTSNPAEGPYSLVIETRYFGLPPEICTDGGSIPLECQASTLSLVDSTFGQPNLMQTYECSPIVERGGEIWYEITLHSYHEFTAQTTYLPPNLDAALWLFDSCGPEAQCLAFADDGVGGVAESLSWTNNNHEPLVIYLGFDSYRMVDTEEGGAFEMDLICQSMVATSPSSWESLRARYRGQGR